MNINYILGQPNYENIKDESNGHCAVCGKFIGIEKAKIELCSECSKEEKEQGK